MSDRREFLKTTCSLCMGAMALGMLVTEEGCKTSSIYTSEANADRINVPVKAMKGQKTLVIKNPAIENNILLVKTSENNYHALLMKCTHRGAWLELLPDRLNCPAHGSAFDFEGNVIMSPALSPLTRYTVNEREDYLEIFLKNG